MILLFLGWFFFGINVRVQFRVNFSPNRPLGRFGLVVAKSLCLSVCLSPSYAIFQGRKGGPRGAKLSFTMASVPAVLHDGISTLKKITSRNVHHYDWQPRGAKLSFMMASVPAVLHGGISTLKMKIYIITTDNFFKDKSRNLPKIVLVSLSESVERFFVSRMRDFYLKPFLSPWHNFYLVSSKLFKEDLFHSKFS